jgi:uncharacterized protein (DUF2336 family)
VGSLLENEKADICPDTYDRIAERAENSTALQAPLVRRANVPPELLNGIYLKAEARLRREIMTKLERIPAEEMEKAFQRSRSRVTSVYGARPDDFDLSLRKTLSNGFATGRGIRT